MTMPARMNFWTGIFLGGHPFELKKTYKTPFVTAAVP
jgi:hypothetical protein